MSASETLKSKFETTSFDTPPCVRSPPIAIPPLLRPPSNRSCFHELFTSPWKWICFCWFGFCVRASSAISSDPGNPLWGEWGDVKVKVKRFEEPWKPRSATFHPLCSLSSCQRHEIYSCGMKTDFGFEKIKWEIAKQKLWILAARNSLARFIGL